VRTLLSFVAGAALAVVAGASWTGCGSCSDEPVAPILGGGYELVDPDPAPFVGYALTYDDAAGTVRETYTRNGVAHDTRYTVTQKSP
jgi:hypothetical protein